MTGSSRGRVRYATTGVIIAITAAITWIVGEQLLGRQAAAMKAADGPVEFGAPLMSPAEMLGFFVLLFLTATAIVAARYYRAKGDAE